MLHMDRNKLRCVFLDGAAFQIAQQGIKIFLNLVIAEHVLKGIIIVDMVIMLFHFL